MRCLVQELKYMIVKIVKFAHEFSYEWQKNLQNPRKNQ